MKKLVVHGELDQWPFAHKILINLLYAMKKNVPRGPNGSYGLTSSAVGLAYSSGPYGLIYSAVGLTHSAVGLS
jgi:hypothetical protein